ncbi:hypothetical protein PS2_008 [Serratia phage PS2]|uniref:Uncharacterized protein n=1 Tax=Serratia phage PS2 TaxID=1481112 RepID=A0A023W6R8_9CAUD|nr:hypothetical protein FF83_gp008 [Serratia phage PS2]AHY25526.1 hypothetical protein PS2_008 [Serratia phage PS2]
MIVNQYWFKSNEHRQRWEDKCPQNQELGHLMEKTGVTVLTKVDIDFKGHPIFDELLPFEHVAKGRNGSSVALVTAYELREYFEKIGQIMINCDDDPEPHQLLGDLISSVDEYSLTANEENAVVPEVPKAEPKQKKKKVPRGCTESLAVHINKTVGNAKAARELIKYLQERFSV